MSPARMTSCIEGDAMTKSNGMRGQKHKNDSDGITPLKWRSTQNSEHPIPEGGNIRVKFPNGPDGGNWSDSTMQCRAYWHDRSLGVFESWDAALTAIAKYSSGAGVAEIVAPKSSGKSSKTDAAVEELERKAAVLLEAARVLRGDS